MFDSNTRTNREHLPQNQVKKAPTAGGASVIAPNERPDAARKGIDASVVVRDLNPRVATRRQMISRADTCRQRAKECRTKAVKTRSVEIRNQYLKLAARWEEAARDADHLEKFTEGSHRLNSIVGLMDPARPA